MTVTHRNGFSPASELPEGPPPVIVHRLSRELVEKDWF